MTRVVALAALLLAGCATQPLATCPAGATAAVSEALYFGTATPDGVVSDAEWQAFLRDVITPRFPEGLSTWRVNGQWRGADGVIVREDSWVLGLVHARDASVDGRIVEITTEYKSRFRQEAVLRVSAPTCISF